MEVKTIQPQTRPTYYEKLDIAGIAETRRVSLKCAMESLHTAYCKMDSQNRALFNEMLEGMTLREALIDFALAEGLNNEL
jgi:hypothetical protein